MTSPKRIGRYEVVGHLATGGMAEILLGRLTGPSGFEQLCVVKRILPHLARQQRFVDMFIDEARIVAGVRHPNVVAVQELAHADDELFLVMEYLAGESLGGLTRRLFTRGTHLDLALAAFIMSEACAGLHAAHELKDEDGFSRDVVHRDVSPQNVFVTYSGQVKVLDFGVAKAANRSAQTEAGQVKGKFAYMSPEQCLGKPVDRRSDIFALGILLWEVCTGRRLFKRKTELATFKAICEQRLVPPSEVVPDFPAQLERVIMRALARRREDRYQTALELRRDLSSAGRALGLGEVPEEELATLMQDTFPDRIEQKQDMLRRFQAGSAPTSIPVAEADEEIELPSAVEDVSTIHTAAEVRLTPEGRRWLAPVLITTVLAAAAGLVVARSMSRDGAPAPSSNAATEPPQPVATPVPSAVPSAKARNVVLRVDTTPPGAKVTIDNVERGVTPLQLSLEQSDEGIEVTLSRAGYRTRTEQVVPNMSQRLLLPLTPVPRAQPAPTKKIPRFR